MLAHNITQVLTAVNGDFHKISFLISFYVSYIFSYFLLTAEGFDDKIQTNFIHQTVEAEITAMMPLQRACVGESQVRNKLSNGPLRVQSKVPVILDVTRT